MNRALRAATIGALLLTPVTLSACSAGQVNQTSSQNRDKVGPSVEVSDDVEVRAVQIAYPGESQEDDPTTGVEDLDEGDQTVYTSTDGAPLLDESTFYEAGDDAELIVTIVNGSDEDLRLTGISAEGFNGVFDEEPPAEEAGSATGTGSTAPTAAAPTASETVAIVVPARSTLSIGLRQYDAESGEPEVAADTQRVFLADMDSDIAPLTPGLSVPVTFEFQGLDPVTVDALVAGPYASTERGEAFDFHEEEGAETGDEQDTEAE